MKYFKLWHCEKANKIYLENKDEYENWSEDQNEILQVITLEFYRRFKKNYSV